MRQLVIAPLLLLAAAAPVLAQRDPFLPTVAFALTGDDDAKVLPVDRTHCVFSVGDPDRKMETFYLNNIQVDRLVFNRSVRKNNVGEFPLTTVELHGNATVYESDETKEPLKEGAFDPALARQMKKTDPNVFSAKPTRSHTTSNEHTLSIYTGDHERLVRAWKYIYANGCSGQKGPR